MESIELKPEDYGYKRTEDENVIPQILNNLSLPESFLYPCKCLKCARKICACRKHSIACCKYCKCSAGKDCQNHFELCLKLSIFFQLFHIVVFIK